MILKCIFMKWDEGVDWLVLVGNKVSGGGGCCESCNEHPGFKKSLSYFGSIHVINSMKQIAS
jgi:hypothetical protein